MTKRRLSTFRVTALAAGALLGACTATTQVTLTPPAQSAICQPQAALKVLVLWRTQWRPDQKDLREREAAAAQGITRFFADASCFQAAVVERADTSRSEFAVPAGSDLLLMLTVRELGPTVKLLSSAALVEGGTEVVVDVAQVLPGRRVPDRQFSIRWQDGGPGVVKGVQTLPLDMAAALKAGLQAR